MKTVVRGQEVVFVAVVTWLVLLHALSGVLQGQTTTGAVEVVTMLAFTEGPAVAPDGTLYFTDLASQRIMRVGRDGMQSTFREHSNLANGLLFDREGRLMACEGGSFVIAGGDMIFRVRTDIAGLPR